MWLFAGFLGVPLIEIALFVTVGGWLGLWLTLGIVLGTGVAGVLVIRWQGINAMEELRNATRLRRDPMGQVAGNALVVLAGLFLILPGFLTDTLGLLLLFPPLRQFVIKTLAARVQVRMASSQTSDRRRGQDVIDGEFFEIGPDPSDEPSRERPTSGWTRH